MIVPTDGVPLDYLEDPDGIDAWEAMKRARPPMSAEDRAALEALEKRIRRPVAAGDPRRHHYIPEFFQKRFATADEQVAVVPLRGDRYRLVHVSRVAVMRDLYTMIDVEIGETVAVERLLAEVDGQAAGAIGRLTGGRFPPGPDDRATLAMWFALLGVRDPHSRRRMEALADSVYKMDLALVAHPDAARTRLRQNLGREPTAEEVGDLVDAASDPGSFEVVPHQNAFIRQMLDSALAMFPHLLRRQYVIVRYPKPGLVFCDRPVILHQRPENRDPLRGVGVINADEIWLPLGRDTALILHSDPIVGERVMEAPDGRSADDFNQAMVLNAIAEIYCHPDDVERLADLQFPPAERPLMTLTGGDWFSGTTDGINDPPQRTRHRRYRREDPPDDHDPASEP